jgi:hypothetical protein
MPGKPDKIDVTAADRDVIARVNRRARERGALDRLKVTGHAITPDHPDTATATARQIDALGLTSWDSYPGYVAQLVNAITPGNDVDEQAINGALGIVKGMQPRDDLEALLLAQMVATHALTMRFARRLAHVDTIEQQDSASASFNKLTRSFAAQMRTLRDYRTGGEQRVVVTRVDLRDNAQAIIGPVGADPKKAGQSHALGDARGASMLRPLEADGPAMSGAGRAGQKGLQDARRKGRGT